MNKQIKDFLFILVTALVIGCVAPTTQRVKPNEEAVAVEADIQREIAFKEAINSQQRLYKIGAPVLKKSLTFCNDKQTKAIGITYANKYDFEGEFQNIAVSKLGLSTTLQITYIFDSYPAEEAGLRTGDILLSINGEDIPEGKDASKRFLVADHDPGAASEFVRTVDITAAMGHAFSTMGYFAELLNNDEAIGHWNGLASEQMKNISSMFVDGWYRDIDGRTNKPIILKDYFDVMRKIQKRSKTSQRDLAQQLGFSLGKLNYCIKALQQKGLIKIKNFSTSF